jgi:glyoxylase-like metal-dependent hydrolase (beta-lactamase superfamily II)
MRSVIFREGWSDDRKSGIVVGFTVELWMPADIGITWFNGTWTQVVTPLGDVATPEFMVDQILGGAITILSAPGHTDGHAIFRIQSGGQSLLHVSDLAHNHVLMLENPAWFIDFDHNPEVAIATRRKIFAEIAVTREHVFGFHLPWPGLGIVIPNGRKAYQWVPSSHRWDF